jgi:hypothetical protein
MTMSATAMHVDVSNRTRRLSDGEPGGDPAARDTRAISSGRGAPLMTPQKTKTSPSPRSLRDARI